MKLRDLAGITLATLLACTTQKEDSLDVTLPKSELYSISPTSQDAGLMYPPSFKNLIAPTEGEAIIEANKKRIQIGKYMSQREFAGALELCYEIEISLDSSRVYNHKMLADINRYEVAIYLMTMPIRGSKKTQEYVSSAMARLKRVGGEFTTSKQNP